MLQEKLKAQTAELHTELEKIMFVGEIMQRTLTPNQYQQILLSNYLIHRDYEQKIHEQLTPQNAQALQISERMKLEALSKDLKAAGLDIGVVTSKTISALKDIPNEAFAMGAMYVLEGATLGGSVIAKQLAKNPNFTSDIAFHYYNCYGNQLIPKWQQFLSVLNSLPERSHLDAIAGAEFMFTEIAKIAKELKFQTV
jgi:heme oxygenase